MGFRENLREILEQLDIQQKELAAQVGISLRNLENYLGKDSSMPSADKAVRIAQALGVSVEYLVTGSESQTKNPLASLRPDFRSLSQLTDQLPKKDRLFVLETAKHLAEFLKDKNKKMRNEE
jgi:transcriptional regulator with XRE-family HTH domain